MRANIFLFGLCFVASSALAAPKKPEAPPLPAPDVKLEIEPGSQGKPWAMRVTNAGSAPLRLVADTRLLRLEVEPVPDTTTKEETGKKKTKPKKKGPTTFTCELPSDMRSTGTEKGARVLELPPGASYLETFDPRLFCLDRTTKLVAGAKVTARLGWPSPKKGKPGKPFVVEPVKEGEVAAAKEIGAAQITLDADALSEPPQPKPLSQLVATAGGARSFVAGKNVETTITVKNEGPAARTLYPRPQLVDARVVDPRGTATTCSGPIMAPAPIIDFVTKLPKNGTWSATVPLDKLCPKDTFAIPGLYLVTPVVRLPAVPDVKDAVAGDLAATAPQLVRVETGDKPFHDAPPKLAK